MQKYANYQQVQSETTKHKALLTENETLMCYCFGPFKCVRDILDIDPLAEGLPMRYLYPITLGCRPMADMMWRFRSWHFWLGL